jgi:ribosomal protein L29
METREELLDNLLSLEVKLSEEDLSILEANEVRRQIASVKLQLAKLRLKDLFS